VLNFCFDDRRLTIRNSLLLLAGLMLLFTASVPAAAQGEWQLYGGTSFLWARTTPQNQNGLSTINEWGWQTDITQYPWHWFGATMEASGFYGRPNIYDPSNNKTYSDLLNTKAYTLMFGPSFAYRRSKAVQPFGHVLFGGINSQYALTSKGAAYFNGTTDNHGEWIFGWGLGGGADIRINEMVGVRGQVDWIPSTFYNFNSDRQSNIRLSVGLVFRFGGGAGKSSDLQSPSPASSENASLKMPKSTTPATEHLLAEQHASTAGTANSRREASEGANSYDMVANSSFVNNAAPVPSNTKSPARSEATTIATQHNVEATNALQPGGAAGPGAPAPAPAPVTAPVAMVEFWSNPSGADVEVDGQYVGSTYSTIAIAPGEHTITVRKENYGTWQRAIHITAGNVRVAAYLEQVKAIVTFQ
jgi:hypothetical protein